MADHLQPAPPPMGWEQDPETELPGHWVSPHYPGWKAWRGVAQLFYARRPRSSPPKVVRGRSLARVALAICQAEGRLGPGPASYRHGEGAGPGCPV